MQDGNMNVKGLNCLHICP